MRSLLFLALSVGIVINLLPGKEPDWPHLSRIASDEHGGGDATISPDGSRFLATSRRSGNWDVWMCHIQSKKWTQLTDDPAEDFEGRFSPDGKSVVFCSTRTGQKDVWVLHLDAHKLKRLTFSEDDDEYPVWSPDGKQIVYTGGPWKQRHIYEIDVEGGTPRQITKTPSFLGACSLGANGDELFCHRYDTGDGDLFRLHRTTGKSEGLTAGPAWDYKPVPSPDNSCIAFSRSVEGPSHIWLLSLNGRVSRQVTDSPHEDRWPTWSQSGRQLLFHRIVEQGQGLRLLELDTNRVTTVVPATESPLYGSFDPTGTRLVYSYQDAGHRGLRILSLEMHETQTLDTGNHDVDFPKWSPDGKSIAFVKRGAGRWDVWVMNIHGKDQRILTESLPQLRGMDGPLSWSPDSSRLVFQSDTEAFAASLFTVDVNTQAIKRLTDGPFFDEAPAWTPDGRSIVFMSTRGGNWTWCLYRLDLDTFEMTELTKPNWEEKNFPQVSPAGRLLFATVDEKGQHVLAEGNPNGLLRTIPESGPGVRWPSFSADFHRVLFSDMSRHVEYWVATGLLEDELGGSREGSVRSCDGPQSDPLATGKTIAPNVGIRSPVALDER